MRTSLLCMLLFGTVASAGEVSTVYQGRLLDSTGQPLSASHSVTVGLHETSSSAAAWSTTETVDVDDGYFAITLTGVGDGSVDLDEVIAGARFVSVAIDGGDELIPRRALGTTPESARTRGIVAIDHTTACEQPGALGWDDLMYVCDGAGWVVVRSGTLSIDNGRLFAPAGSGNVGIGTTDPNANLHVVAPDTEVATIAATGTTQGTGVVYVGQSMSYGAGLVYNGDDNPAALGVADDISLFRRDNGTDTAVLSYRYDNNAVNIPGPLYTTPSVYARNTSIGSSGQCVSCDAEDSLISCFPHALDNCTGNPCDADISAQPQNNRCCTGSNDHTGFSLTVFCMRGQP